jgi:two-component system, NarL family, sensor kinase
VDADRNLTSFLGHCTYLHFVWGSRCHTPGLTWHPALVLRPVPLTDVASDNASVKLVGGRRPWPASARNESSYGASAIYRFALSGLVALVLVGIGGAFFLDRLSEDEAIYDARQTTRTVGNATIAPNLSDELLEGKARAVARMDAVVRDHLLGVRIARVKIWSPDGRIVYSDEPRLIGSRYQLAEEELEALQTGDVVAQLSDLDSPENRYERDEGELLEVYMPLATPNGKKLLFEAYLRRDAVATGERRIWLQFVPLLVAVLVLLWLLQLPLARAMVRRLSDNQREREALLQQAIESSEAERRRIAHDLHDGVIQDLAGLSYQLAAAADRPPTNHQDEAVAATFRRGASVSRQSMRSLRSLLVEIYPPNLHTSGLRAALTDMASTLDARGIRVDVDIPPDLTVAPNVQSLLFRAAQEGLRNVVAHADANTVDVRLTSSGVNVVLEIEDDGCGYSVEEAERRRREGHVGLQLLSELTTHLGGVFEIRSQQERGTRLRLEVPAE